MLHDLEKNGIDVNKLTYYGVSQDDPNAHNSEVTHLCFDVCVEASNEVMRLEDKLEANKGQINEGSYAVFLHKGPLERLTDSYYYIYGKWVYENAISLIDTRQFIRYINPFDRTIAENEKVTEIYIPIRV